MEEKYKDIGDKNGSLSEQNKATFKGESLLSDPGAGLLTQSKVAIFIAMHLALLQQFVGINAVVPYGG